MAVYGGGPASLPGGSAAGVRSSARAANSVRRLFEPLAATASPRAPAAEPHGGAAAASSTVTAASVQAALRPEVPLRLYRQGLPHRDLGPPQSMWEADRSAAVVALSDRVQQLEHELHQQQQQHQQPGAYPPDPDRAMGAAVAAQAVMPPPAVDLLPVPRSVLGGTSHASAAAYDGIHASGAPPAPVTYYPPPPSGQPMTADAAVVRLQAAQGPRGQARALAASVAASAAATVPSVMMRRRRNENAQPRGNYGTEEGENHFAHGGGAAASGGVRAGGAAATSSIGVSAPMGYASATASAAASVHVAALREAGPLQPAGPYPMVAAALAVGTPGMGGSTWEQAKMRALMSLEQQRDALRAQLDEFRGQEVRHRRELTDLREEHRKQMQDAAGLTGRKFVRLMRSAWIVYSRRLMALKTSRALHAWRRIATRNRRLVWAAAVWRQRDLGVVMGEWQMLVLTSRRQRQARQRAVARYRRTVLLAWAAAAQEGLLLRRLGRRVALARCRRLLAAWARRAGELRAKRQRLRGAEAHRCRVLLSIGWRGLAAAVARSRQDEAALRQRLARVATVAAFKTWVAQTRLGRRLDAMHRRAALRTALRSWAALSGRMCCLRRKLAALHATWRRRRQAILLAGWRAAARRLALLTTAGRALETAVRHDLMSHALTALRLAPRERAWGRRRGVAALRAWCGMTRRAVRNRRILLARQLSRNRSTLAAAFDAWRVLGKARSVRLHLREIHRLQELEPMYEHQMELVRQDRAAVQGHVRAVMSELNALRGELLRGFVVSAEGGLLGKPLRWHSLPPDPDQWQPPPRCRHSTFCLRALQLPHAPPPGAATQPLPVHRTMRSTLSGTATATSAEAAEGGTGSTGTMGRGGAAVYRGTATAPLQLTGTSTIQGHHAEVEAVIPDVAGVLVVFGGVNEEEWFRDVHVLEISYADGGGATFRWHQVEVQPEAEPAGGAEAGTLRSTAGTGGTGKLPLHTRRDHAACVTSPNQFVVVGGFDGTAELMDIQAVTVRAAEDSAGWAATVRAVVPRNRTPPGRSHHTVTAHDEGRSLYVFGGYASSRGTLGELWAFHLDHLEWWQPNTTGDQPPPRRNHVAALVGGRLFVHGGFNGMECLGDSWVLDPQTWHWEQLRTSGSAPRSRRGHAAEVVDDRYLVVHGGYDGSGELADGAVLDTATGAWRDLAAAGGPQDMPTARAYHTLTLVGHVMVALGGSGPMGHLLDMHLLESPPLVAGLAQQYRLMSTAAQLSATQAGLADMEAALAVTRHRAELAEQQLQVLREGSSELLARHNAALADIDRLKARVAAEAVRLVAAEATTAEAQLALATAERRLRRTREGGQEVAAAARDMHDIVCDLREEVARLRSQLLTTMQQQTRDASQVASTAAERQLLQQQLAGAQQEAALLRGMLAAAETEFRAALDRQRSAAEAELAAAAEHAKQLAVAAATAAGGAAATGTAADMDLVVLHQLAIATARAETAELRLHAMEREHGGLQADISNIKRQLQQQRQARDAAEERAAAAMQHMHASELRYQMQVEDLQRQLAEAQRERWRQDLQVLPPRKRAAPPQQPEDAPSAAAAQVPEQMSQAPGQGSQVPGQMSQAPGQGSQAPAQASQAPVASRPGQQGEDEGGGEGSGGDSGRADAEWLLRTARPPAGGLGSGLELNVLVQRSMMPGRAGVELDPMDPGPHFMVQYLEQLELEDPTLDMLPEVARLLELQRRLLGQG
ncbi:hypothetical protein PLESTF_000151200 [Pleodorina starrii]|nr:hypothetical protein PLESTF_000151200 [Pleodorina starrii]